MRWINELAGLARPSLMFSRDALPARTPKEEIVKTMLFAAAAFAVAGFAAPVFADNASPRTDEVRASFDRMLGHQADPRTAAKVDREADPLRKAVVAALWERQDASYHVPTQLAANRLPASKR